MCFSYCDINSSLVVKCNNLQTSTCDSPGTYNGRYYWVLPTTWGDTYVWWFPPTSWVWTTVLGDVTNQFDTLLGTNNQDPLRTYPLSSQGWSNNNIKSSTFNGCIGITPSLTKTLTQTLTPTRTATKTPTNTPTPSTTCPTVTPPFVASSSQCGYGIPTMFATSSVGNIFWYGSQTSKDKLSQGPFPPQTPITATTVFWAEAVYNNCSSLRVSGTASVCNYNKITATTSSSVVCVGTPITLNFNQENTYDTTYTGVTWSSSQYNNGNGLTGATTRATNNPLTITPTGTGLFEYYALTSGNSNYCGAGNGECHAFSSVQVNVIPQPVITSFVVSGNSNCDGYQTLLYFSGNGTNISKYVWNVAGQNYTGQTQLINISLHQNTLVTLNAYAQNDLCYTTTATTYPIYYVPDALSSASSTQCGYGIPYALPTSNYNVPNHTYRWYGSLTGSTILYEQMTENGYTQYGYPITSSTTFYVSEISVYGCESSRTAIVCTVTPSDEITYSASSVSILSGQSFSVIISGITGGVNTFDSVTISGDTGGGVIGTQSLSIDTDNPLLTFEYTITPTSRGTFNYLVLANDSLRGCTSFVIFTIVVT